METGEVEKSVLFVGGPVMDILHVRGDHGASRHFPMTKARILNQQQTNLYSQRPYIPNSRMNVDSHAGTKKEI